LIKWGRLKDNAEITKGSLIIPYDGVVYLNFEVFAVEPPEEHDQLVATIPASIKYGLTDRATTVLKTKLLNLKNEVNGLRSEWPKVDNLMCIENKLSEIITLIQNHQEPK